MLITAEAVRVPLRVTLVETQTLTVPALSGIMITSCSKPIPMVSGDVCVCVHMHACMNACVHYVGSSDQYNLIIFQTLYSVLELVIKVYPYKPLRSAS